MDPTTNSTLTRIPGSIYAKFGHEMAVALPGDLGSFTYTVDARQATAQQQSYSLAVVSYQNSTVMQESAGSYTIGKGESIQRQVSTSPTPTTTTPTTTQTAHTTVSATASASQDLTLYSSVAIVVVIAGGLVVFGLLRRKKSG